MCSHWVLLARRKPVFVQMLDLGAAHSPGAPHRQKLLSRWAARAAHIRAMVAGTTLTLKRSRISSAKRSSPAGNGHAGDQTTMAFFANPWAVLHRRRSRVLQGNAARKFAGRTARSAQTWARCSVTAGGCGSGRSKTCRAAWDVGHRRRQRRSAAGTARRVIDRSQRPASSPAAGFRPGVPSARPGASRTGSRKLMVRAGLLGPSLDGGLLLLLPSRPMPIAPTRQSGPALTLQSAPSARRSPPAVFSICATRKSSASPAGSGRSAG